MNAKISWVLEVEIIPGQLENFRVLAGELIASTHAEPDTLVYEWHLNDAGTLCHIYESYRDGAALVAHVLGFGRFADRFLQACRPVRFSVYGTPDEDVKAILADFQPVYYSSFLGGFSR
jgi:quinol monooxygenase YgiN